MAAPISVPASQRPAIKELANLSTEAYQALHQCLTESRAYAEPDALLEQTSKAVEKHTRFGGQILGTAIGLRSLMDSTNLTLGDVAAGVASDAQTIGYVPADRADVLSRRLTELLEMPAVAVTAKAYLLFTADPSPFNDVRIVSDVRPIFAGKHEGLEFTGSMIVHHLHIQVSGEGKDKHTSLTSADLLKLKRTVDRALEKDKKLREALRSGPLSPLEMSMSVDKER
jgi:hypothetical protein